MFNFISNYWKQADSAEHKLLIALCVIVSILFFLVFQAN